MLIQIIMLDLHNVFRKMEDLEPFLEHEILNKIALQHAKRMARLLWLNDYRLKELSNKYTEFEEIVWCISMGHNQETAIKKLINDFDTRYYILGNYKYFGAGSYKGKNGSRYWCMLYGNLKE